MEARKEVVAAISAAVLMYMQAQQAEATVETAPATQQVPRTEQSLWAVAGRQSAMDMRRYLQMRMFR